MPPPDASAISTITWTYCSARFSSQPYPSGGAPHRTRKAHERVLASGTQQEQLIEALLTLARGQAGLDRHEPFDLADVTSQVLNGRRAEALYLSLNIRAAIYPAPLTGDPRLAERMVANLIDNALRHNEPGGWIEVTTGSRAGRAVLTVTNTGPEIPAAETERLLRPFQRLGADRTRHGRGLGLGLSIVAAMSEAHGATLSARPRPDGGLRVEVTFPAPGAPATPTGSTTDPGMPAPHRGCPSPSAAGLMMDDAFRATACPGALRQPRLTRRAAHG